MTVYRVNADDGVVEPIDELEGCTTAAGARRITDGVKRRRHDDIAKWEYETVPFEWHRLVEPAISSALRWALSVAFVTDLAPEAAALLASFGERLGYRTEVSGGGETRTLAVRW